MMIGKGKFLFNLLGITIVGFWIVMMGILVKKTGSSEKATGQVNEDSIAIINAAQREWKEIYLKDRKVGYSVNLIKPFEKGYFIQEETFLKLNLMGLGRSVYTVTQSGVDEKFILQNFFFKMTSGVVNYSVSGKVEGNQLLIKTGKGRRKRTKKITLLKPPMIGAGIGPLLKTLKISVGETFRIPFFDPSTMAQEEAVFRVVGREQIRINKIDYNAFRLETEIWGRLLTSWIDEKGVILKEEGFMGLSIVKSSAANAPMDIEEGGEEDFYEMTAVPVDRKLPKPGRLSYLKIKLEGIDDVNIPKRSWDSGRQRFRNGIMEVDREKSPFKASYAIPYNEPDDKLAPFLDPEFNIESDLKEIIEKARDIAGKDKNPVSVSGMLLRWVYENLDKRPVVSIPSALEVLQTRVGDCNEHATLLTALLRASGIPARLAIGIVYSRNKFFYHAWTEAYVGEWISMDATLNQFPADVSHIRLMQGNLDKQVEIMGLIGKLKLEVLDFKYD
ncbi:transglutaminase family protein [Thermodesulfobacteriota bacterium]